MLDVIAIILLCVFFPPFAWFLGVVLVIIFILNFTVWIKEDKDTFTYCTIDKEGNVIQRTMKGNQNEIYC